MNQDTIALLKECNSGCKSATNSLEQIYSYAEDEKLKEIIVTYNHKHVELGDKFHTMLEAYGDREKDPAPVAKAFAFWSTGIKLMMNDNSHKIADVLIDGCNMGIKSVSEYLNKYAHANDESKALANELLQNEKELMEKLLAFL